MSDARDLLDREDVIDEAKVLLENGSYASAAEVLSARHGVDITKSQLRHAMLRAHRSKAKPKRGESKCKNADVYRAQKKPRCMGGKGCDVCRRKWSQAEQHRSSIASDIDPLPNGYLMPGSTTWDRGEPDRQKKQEYTRNMGRVADSLHSIGVNGPMDPSLSSYISNLAEDERRFMNRRRARSVSIALARDTLATRQFINLAERVFKGRIQASGYALKTVSSIVKRMATLHLSDLHIGAKLNSYENPEAFGGAEEARRLAYILIETAEFKTQYRDHTQLNLLLNGDVIEGLLMHNNSMMDQAPMAEQEVAFIGYMSKAIAFLAKSFPSVHVICEPGNHGRDKLIHEGRATSSKWNGHEWKMFKVLEMMSCDLKNVDFSAPKAPVQVVKVFDKHMLVLHGDTELKLQNPTTGAKQNEKELNRINANLTYGKKIDLLTFGHFHQPAVVPYKTGMVVANSALVPANGHARSEGYETRCGQYLWESVPGFIFGDNRFLEVGPVQDSDTTLDKIIKPYDYER
jgi:hypothetical protein